MLAGLAACGKEPPPRSVQEFVDDPILLEATMVRCSRDRAATRYDAECVAARDAVDRIAAVREQARREGLESESERKRQALRRAQQAAAEARRRAEEAARRREEAEYFGEFEPLPPGDEAAPENDVPEDRNDGADGVQSYAPVDAEPHGATAVAPADTAPPPGPEVASGPEPRGADSSLEEVREELRRRGEAEREEPPR
jgi:hypothetical protein